MKTQKGNVAMIVLIVIVVAITAGVIGWMFINEIQLTDSYDNQNQSDPINKQVDSLVPPALPE